MLHCAVRCAWHFFRPKPLTQILRTVSPQPYTTAGLYFTPFAQLMTYPKTIQTINYDTQHEDLLDGRTSDGLPLILGCAFQYRLDPAGLYQLYRNFNNEHEKVYTRVGAHLITEFATNFTAYQFFNEKQSIAEKMQHSMNEYFSEHLGAFVESFQINEDDLPQLFYDAVLSAATTKQNITRTQKLLESTRVSLGTEVIKAYNKANQVRSFGSGEPGVGLA